MHRFPNGVTDVDGTLRWDVGELFGQVLAGLAKAAASARATGERIASIGIDTWAVDYGLVDATGRLAGMPFSYRDARGPAAVDGVHARADPQRLYAVTGLQHLPFNTIYQLAAEHDLAGKQALLIPDLLAFWLTGARRTEATNASTTGLVDAGTGAFSAALTATLDVPADLFAPLVQPGETIGALLPSVVERTGLPAATPVVAVGSHDTASAVAAVPAQTPNFAYISSGTWSLVGVELDVPVLTEASRAANFTNERGVDGTIRYLRNVGGLWLLSECQRQWRLDGVAAPDLPGLLAAAADEPAGGPLIDVDADEFIAPGRMPARIAAAVGATGAEAPTRPVAVVRCILDSLAAAYARTVRQAVELSGRAVDVVHIVGGGSQNTLLCQLTADATRLPVIAGPVEATALGNVLVQARAAGVLDGGLARLRAIVAAGAEPVRYEPRA